MDNTPCNKKGDRWEATISDAEIHSLAEEALDAFWVVVVQHYPQAISGDLSPDRTHALSLAAETALREWIESNVLPPPEGMTD